MKCTASLVMSLIALTTADMAWSCTTTFRPTPAKLVADAEIIVVARAQRVRPVVKRAEQTFTTTDTEIEFAVREVLKGTPPAATLWFNGIAVETDDRNDRPVPYDFVRPGGRGGNCYALAYRLGADYLLMLKQATGPDATMQLTPYWAALMPTNEQLFGDKADRWRAWVVETLRNGGG